MRALASNSTNVVSGILSKPLVNKGLQNKQISLNVKDSMCVNDKPV